MTARVSVVLVKEPLGFNVIGVANLGLLQAAPEMR